MHCRESQFSGGKITTVAMSSVKLLKAEGYIDCADLFIAPFLYSSLHCAPVLYTNFTLKCTGLHSNLNCNALYCTKGEYQECRGINTQYKSHTLKGFA